MDEFISFGISSKIQKVDILMKIINPIIREPLYFQVQRTVDGRSLRFETYYKKYQDLKTIQIFTNLLP
jgi:hypothetical protein